MSQSVPVLTRRASAILAEPKAVAAPGPLRRCWQAWDQFWFRPSDPTLMGFIRICAGFMVLYIHLAYSFDLQKLFGRDAWIDLPAINSLRLESLQAPVATDWNQLRLLPADGPQKEWEQRQIDRWGVNPRQAIAVGQPRWSIWYHVTDPVAMRVVHTMIVLIMFCFMIGLFTRVTGVLAWLGLLSYIHRAPSSLFGMDTIMIVVVMYLLLGSCGAALSVDRLLARYWANRRARQRGQPLLDFPPPAPHVSSTFALRLLQIHLCFIYGMSGMSKLLGQVWWNGQAVWGTMANYEFAPMRVGLYMDTLRFVAQHRWLWEVCMTAGTYGTLAFEVGFPFLIWNRTLRPWYIIAAVLLHLNISFFMGLVCFSLMMLAADLAFVSPVAVREFIARLTTGRLAFLKVQSF
jgi:hypothetical protein